MSKTTDSEARRYRFATEAVHRGEEPDFSPGGSGDVVIPIHLSTTFARKEADKPTGGYEYSRSGNPTRAALEKRLAALEGGRRGLAFFVGCGGADGNLPGVFCAAGIMLSSLMMSTGGRGGCSPLCSASSTGLMSITWMPSSTDAVRAAMTPRTRPYLAGIAHESAVETLRHYRYFRNGARRRGGAGADTGVLVVVDNTFASPYFQNPLGFGADIVVHSGTKYLGGHSDCVGGAVITGNEELAERVWYVQNSSGGVLSPFDSYMLLRGIKTLPLRMERCSENALKIAEFLEAPRGRGAGAVPRVAGVFAAGAF